MPALEFDFRISVKLNPELSRAENRVHKEIITVASGSWSGSFGNGRILVRDNQPAMSCTAPGKYSLGSCSDIFCANLHYSLTSIEFSELFLTSWQAGGYDLGQARGYRPIRIVEGAFVLQTSDQVPAM